LRCAIIDNEGTFDAAMRRKGPTDDSSLRGSDRTSVTARHVGQPSP